MTWLQRPRRTLLGRITLFLTIFCAAFLLQLGIGQYQSKYIMKPMENRMEDIQTISRFLDSTEKCMDVLKEYRWDYGDSEALTDDIQGYLTETSYQMESISAKIGETSEEYYLLVNAVHTAYETCGGILKEIMLCLPEAHGAKAAQLYYNKAEPCGGYLLQYTRQLLEQAIHDSYDAFGSLQMMNKRLEQLRSAVTVLSVAAACMMMSSLVSLIRFVHQMSQASEQISQGHLDIPDVDENRQDEGGYLARTFNEMRRSMKRQMELLNENNKMERELHAKETEALELQALIEREKLQQLRSQINPHFMFNTLNVIMYHARQENAEQTGILLGSLSRMLRNALGDNETRSPLSREVQIVNEFYSLYHARFGDRILLEWHIDPEVDLTETLIPSFLVQPLVENAFLHGLAPKEEDGRVDIRVRCADGSLFISVEDNGVGMSQEALSRLKEHLYDSPPTGEHIGMYNVATRLRLAGEEYGLDIRSEPDAGTTVVIRLPLVIAMEKEESDDETVNRG